MADKPGGPGSAVVLGALLLSVGVLAVLFGAITPHVRVAGYRPPTELPQRAVYRVSELGSEATGNRELVYNRATLEEHVVYLYERRGESWRELVLWSAPASFERPGDLKEYRPGIYREVSDGEETTKRTDDRHAPRHDMTLGAYNVTAYYLMKGTLKEVGHVPCGESVVCGQLTTERAYTASESPMQGYWSIPLLPRNVMRTTTLYDLETRFYRRSVAEYNGEVIGAFEMLCTEPGPDPCADDDLPPKVRAEGVSLAARISPS